MTSEDVVTQEMMEEYLRAKDTVSRLNKAIKHMLESGAAVEPGERKAEMKTVKRRSPKWKEELRKRVTGEELDAIIEATPESEVVQLRVK